jgi:aspartyl-tRNA synthetase
MQFFIIVNSRTVYESNKFNLPKNKSGRDVMIDAQSIIDDSQLKELKIKLDL